MRTKIKICGITNIEDALAASKLDIDYIGLIFISESPRCVSITTADKICKNIVKNKAINLNIIFIKSSKNLYNYMTFIKFCRANYLFYFLILYLA